LPEIIMTAQDISNLARQNQNELSNKIESIAVIGSGQMGRGIAQVFAAIGKPTLLYDIQPSAVERAIDEVSQRLSKSVEKGKLAEEERLVTLSNLKQATSVEDLKGSDLFIEAIVENFDAKRSLFEELDRYSKPSAVYASNTSSISI